MTRTCRMRAQMRAGGREPTIFPLTVLFNSLYKYYHNNTAAAAAPVTTLLRFCAWHCICNISSSYDPQQPIYVGVDRKYMLLSVVVLLSVLVNLVGRLCHQL